LQIESYEPYHIGNKLNPATNFDSLKKKLKEKLQTAEYKITEETLSGQQVIFDKPIEVLGLKNDVRIELNHLAQALNVIGTNPENVSSIYMEINSFLPEIGYEIENLSLFFEIVTSIIVKSDGKSPNEILNDSIKLNMGSFFINDIQNTNIIGIRIGGENTENDNNFTLSIEPSTTSPNSRFMLNLRYRSKDKENIQIFHQELDEKIMQLLTQLEWK